MPMDRNTGARIDRLTHVGQCIDNVMKTPIRTRPMELEYGTDVLELVDIATTPDGRARIMSATADAVTTFETRPEIRRVSFDVTPEGQVFVAVHWTLGESQQVTGVAI